jgi:hypothetical protein
MVNLLYIWKVPNFYSMQLPHCVRLCEACVWLRICCIRQHQVHTGGYYCSYNIISEQQCVIIAARPRTRRVLTI